MATINLEEVVQKKQTRYSKALLEVAVNQKNWKFYEKGDESWRPKIYTKEEMAFKNNVLKSLIYGQLAIDANDVLIGTKEHNNYLKNVLNKANKELERKARKNLSEVYGADPTMLLNVFETIDEFVSRLADKLPHEFFYLNSIIDEYSEDPTKYIGRKVMLKKQAESIDPKYSAEDESCIPE